MDSEDALTTTNLVKASLPTQNNDSTEIADECKDNTETTSYEEENASVPVNINNEIDDTSNAPLEDVITTLETSTLTTTYVEKSKKSLCR